MFPGEDMLQEGIAAFQAGDRTKARELLQEVVKVDPENEQAWYYLAASETNTDLRKQYLQQVLDINPENAKAREVLDRIKSREESGAQVVAEPSVARAAGSDNKGRIHPLDPLMESVRGAAEGEPGSFKVPFNIPGAPERMTWEGLGRDGVALMRVGLDLVLRKPGVYSDEVSRATWWRFWLMAGAAAVGGAILSIFTALFLLVRFGTSLFGIVSILFTPFFFAAISLVTLYLGCYVSYRYALTRGGNASFVKHAYTVAVVWAPITLLSSALGLLFTLFGFGGWLVSLLLFIYEIMLISEGFQNLHVFGDTNQKWITAGVMIVTTAVVGFILSVIFGGLIVAGAMPL